MDAHTVRQIERLTALKTALANRDVLTRLHVQPVPFLVIPVLHLPGHRMMIHVVPGRAGPDTYMWEHGNHQHPASDPAGAAARLAAQTRSHRDAT